MKFKTWGLTDIGLKRTVNQDAIFIDASLGLYLVADGMGGHRGGNIAAQMAIEIVSEFIAKNIYSVIDNHLSPEQLLLNSYTEASRTIYEFATKTRIDLYGMGTTLVASLVYDRVLYIGNIGDSRAYLYNDPYLWQLTEDHSCFYEQVKSGSVVDHSIKNILTRSLGFESSVLVDVFKKELHPNDKIIMCSDGLTGRLSDTDIADILKTTKDENIPTVCIERANKAGGQDNISAIYLKVFE